jgi:hypothetical protein
METSPPELSFSPLDLIRTYMPPPPLAGPPSSRPDSPRPSPSPSAHPHHYWRLKLDGGRPHVDTSDSEEEGEEEGAQGGGSKPAPAPAPEPEPSSLPPLPKKTSWLGFLRAGKEGLPHWGRHGGGGGGRGGGGRFSRHHHPPRAAETNEIRTAKYSLWNFAPKFLLLYFSRPAYLYFLIQVWSGSTFVSRFTEA